MSWVDRLQEITGWREEPWECDWSGTEAALGVAIPSDYKELCERFGPGYFTDSIRIIHDRGEEGMLSQWQSDLRLCRHGGLSSIWDPYHIFGCTERRGLITWSHNDWGVYHWLADADINPDEWPTLVVGELGLPDGSGYRYDMPASEVIYRVLADPEFEPFTISGSGVRPWFYRFDPDTAEDPEMEE